jgi:2,4-dienoyl-CoA reductase-like NADH-dependent reductase (Old Yellow Enzyme family)
MVSILFEAARIKGVEVKNRFVRSATVEGMGTADGRPAESLRELYYALAEGEVGLIVTAAALVDGEAYKKRRYVEGRAYDITMDEDRYVEDWQEVVAGVHERGSKIAMQLVHMGRQENPKIRGSSPLAPSAVPLTNTDIVPREMTLTDIEETVERFAQSCRRVMEAGFDAVQLHGGHGYLISNFISPYANVRNDAYGGSTENRARFITDIVKRARELVGEDYPIMIKMNCDEFIDGGLTKDDAVDTAKIITKAGIDCIEVTGGTGADSPLRMAVPGINKEEKEAYFASYARALKEHVSVPIILVGGLRTPSVMVKVLEEGVADLLSLSRPFIREPGLVRRWKRGDLEKAKCISCNKCALYMFKQPLRCYVEEPLEDT